MEKIKFDKKNYRKHNDRNKELIKKSLSECGAGRSILIDKENEIIAGNGIYEQAKKLNIPVKIIETDGSELVVVKRTDLQSDDEKRKQLAIMDNSTSDTSEFDIDLLQEEFEIKQLKDFGLDFQFEEENIESIDVDFIDNYNENYNIIVKCKNYDLAEKFNEKFNLELNFDNQRTIIDVERLL